MQEEGAARREKNAKRAKGKASKQKERQTTEQAQASAATSDVTASLEYKKIVITAESLVSVTEEWIRESGAAHAAWNLHTLTEQPVDSTPIFLVALHACGSLTLDVLRAFMQQLRRAQREQVGR